MSQLRFVKTPEQLIEAAENNLEFFDANMQAIKAWYKTEPGLIEQLIPAPLEPHADPMVRIVISRVFVDLNGGMDFGAATFGVNCMYKGKEGIYEITMPMETEGVVVGGRETYGEPKKIADVTASKNGDDCVATVTRHGITYLELKESGYFILKKKTDSIELTLGKNYLLPEETFLFDAKEIIFLGKFLGKDENNVNSISFRVNDFLNLFFGIKSEEISLKGIEIVFESENEKKLPSKIILSNDEFKLIFLVRKNEPY